MINLENAIQSERETKGRTQCMLSVLAVGPAEATDSVRKALIPHSWSSVLAASNYWELCSLALRDTVDVSIAILIHSISGRDLQRSAELVRRRWPHAAILLVGNDSNALEDMLYDHRVYSGIPAVELLVVIERLASRHSAASAIGGPFLRPTRSRSPGNR